MSEFWSGFLIGALLFLLVGYFWAMFVFHHPVHCEVMGCGAENLERGACTGCYMARLVERDKARQIARIMDPAREYPWLNEEE